VNRGDAANEQIQALLDKHAIYEVLVRYCRGVDRCDEDLIRSAFHDDSYDDHGYWKGPGHELAGFLADRLRKANSATTHSVTNVLIEVDGDVARSEAQVHATLIRRGSDEVDVVGARYLDRFSRRAGIWRIDHRTVVLDWQQTQVWQDSTPQVPTEGFARGARSPEDPSYAEAPGHVADVARVGKPTAACGTDDL
jgi:SnoaL-like domain